MSYPYIEGSKKVMPRCDSARSFIHLKGIDDETACIVLDKVDFSILRKLSRLFLVSLSYLNYKKSCKTITPRINAGKNFSL